MALLEGGEIDGACFMVVACVVVTAAAFFGDTGASPPSGDFFSDPAFARGFELTAASHPVPKVVLGTLLTGPSPEQGPPAWRMAQWGTRELLQPGTCADAGGGQWSAENGAKRVVVERPGEGPTGILLEVRGGHEYEGRMRAAGEAWPHLLIEQRFAKAIELKDLSVLVFKMDARVPFCRPAAWSSGKLNPGLHTAQVSAFWTVHNRTQGSPDCGEMIWFGIPFFDARHDIPPSHYALDTGKSDASGKFICLLDGKRFWTSATGDGAWHPLEVDLMPLLREALSLSQQHGYLKSTRFEDLVITSFNLGWEMPGPYDAALEVRGLSLR